MKAAVIFYLLFLPLIFSCHVKNKLKDQDDNLSGQSSNNKVIGSYTDNNIRVLIFGYSKDSVRVDVYNKEGMGYEFIASFLENEDVYLIKAPVIDENKNRGEYTFAFNPLHPNIISGKWKPDNPTMELQLKTYSLTRNPFIYSPDVGYFPQASQRLLVDSDVNNLDKETLETMRNEIYAKRGYIFKNRYQRMQFETQDWYIPCSIDVKDSLNNIEKKNVAFIKKFEKFAKDDDFGR
jgi:hypothetical protein